MAKAIRRVWSSKVTDLVMDTVIYIASTTYSYILLSQFATQVAKNTITWSWTTFDIFAFFAITSMVSGLFILAEFYNFFNFFGEERSRALSMFLLLLRVMIWITVIVELVATAAVATILELGVVGSG